MQQIKTFDNAHIANNMLSVDSNKSKLINSTITFHGGGGGTFGQTLKDGCRDERSRQACGDPRSRLPGASR